MLREDLRNIAIIAHVDHGKTTLVDEMLKQGGVYRENQVTQERAMDSNPLERERGITILAKNTAVHYYNDDHPDGVKINIIDTPGHADFSGEVERILKMVNGVLLLVDAAEGPMPQTRFVLQKALNEGLRVIVVLNKIDRPDARAEQVEEEVLELLLDLEATTEQFDSPMVFCSGRAGTASLSPDEIGVDLKPLFEVILEYIPAPEGNETAPVEMLVSSIDYNEYVGRIGIGRIEKGTLNSGQDIIVTNWHDPNRRMKTRITAMFGFDGLSRTPIQKACVGDIVAFSGSDMINIGDTLTDPQNITSLPFIKIDEPTMEMTFSVNDSPFAGREGKFVTSRQIRDRLYRELLRDVSLRVEDTDSSESFRVCGRGEMHLSVLIETMRREGYELCASTPRVLTRVINDVLHEPIELVIADVPEQYSGAVIEKLGGRKGEMRKMELRGSRMFIEYLVPSRCLIGYRTEFLTDTRGEGIFNSAHDSYAPWKGDITIRFTGSLTASEEGEASAYGCFNAQDRGMLFISPQTQVYEGMIVGECPKKEDIAVNVCRRKQLNSVRSSGSAEEALRLVTPRKLSLEEAIEFIAEDELIEVTPKNIRLRKRILNTELRLKAQSRSK